jgi:hypothetical protein
VGVPALTKADALAALSFLEEESVDISYAYAGSLRPKATTATKRSR